MIDPEIPYLHPSDAAHRHLLDLRDAHRRREFWLRASIRLGNSIGAVCRSLVSAGKASAEATELEKELRHLKPDTTPSGDLLIATWLTCEPLLRCERDLHAEIKQEVASMEETAAKLPGAGFIERTPGFGALGLAQLLGEAGHLCNYPKPELLWNRFGVGAHQVAGRAHVGRSKRRRTILYRVSDSLVVKRKGPYRDIYDTTKAAELEQAEAAGIAILPQAKANAARAKGKEVLSVRQVHFRALRAAERQLLIDLWEATREECECAGSVGVLEACEATLPSTPQAQPLAESMQTR